MGATREELERQFRADLERLKCLRCDAHFTDAAIDFGFAQPSDYERDGPFTLRCEHCQLIQRYDLFSRRLSE